MAKTATIRTRAEPDLKAKAEGVLGEQGSTPPQAITLYYREIVRGRGIHFPLRPPEPALAGNG